MGMREDAVLLPVVEVRDVILGDEFEGSVAWDWFRVGGDSSGGNLAGGEAEELNRG